MEIKTDPVNLQTLFSGYGTRYSVPDYQRNYSWTADQVEELWMDINTSRRNNSDYFMGTVVLNKVEGRDDEFEIVDGQQRLSTFSLLFSVIAALGKQFEKDDQVFPNTPRTPANIETSEKVYAMAKDRLFCTSEPDHYFLTINRKDRSCSTT